MTRPPGFVERSARCLVDSVRLVARQRIALSCVGLVLTMLVAAGYVVIEGLRFHPARSTISVRIQLSESGGLLQGQDVTLRGTPIGRVTAVNFTDSGVEAMVAIDARVPIPRDSQVRVSALSPAGEQYLDFRPNADAGPTLTDGSTLERDQTTIPVPLATLLASADGALSQLDPAKLTAVSKELRVSHQGPEKLAAIMDGGTFLISTLDSVLPQTIDIIRSSRTVLTTLADGSAGVTRTSENLQQIMSGVRAMDGGFRTLTERGSSPMRALDNIISDNSDTMVQLLGNLTTIAQLSYLRVPALTALFPTTRGSAVDAVSGVIRDGGIWAIADIYPRYGCDYGLPRRPPSQADFPEPYRYTYCSNPDPSVLIRGARNAPRPPGDDTAGPPADYDPLATTDPTPRGSNSIPTPYGGPVLPALPPN